MTNQPINQNQAQAQTILQQTDKSDHLGKTRTLYDASAFEVFWRNFLSGLARGIGSVVIWIFFIAFLAYTFSQIFWPQIQPFFSSYLNLMNSLGNPQTITTPIIDSNPSGSSDLNNQVEDIVNQPAFQNLINQMQTSP